jgi:hypothetical protein
MNTYFLYRNNNIANFGPVIPAYQAGVTLNLYHHDGLTLGSMDDELAPKNYLDHIREYSPVVVSEQVAKGYPLIGITQLLESQDENGENKVFRDLTAEEAAAQKAAEEILAKLGMRSQIELVVGDQADLLSDLGKRLAILDRIVLSLVDVVENAGEMSPEIKAVADQYKADHAAKLITDTIDINGKTLMENYLALRDRNNTISEILTGYYN